LTLLDPQVILALVDCTPGAESGNGQGALYQDRERANQLGREMHVYTLPALTGPAIVNLALEDKYDLIVVPLLAAFQMSQTDEADRTTYIVRNAPCRVFLASPPSIPQEVEKDPLPTGPSSPPTSN
jgi:hypothetical protein